MLFVCLHICRGYQQVSLLTVLAEMMFCDLLQNRLLLSRPQAGMPVRQFDFVLYKLQALQTHGLLGYDFWERVLREHMLQTVAATFWLSSAP